MRIRDSLLAVAIAFLATGARADAGIGPSFHLDDCVWNATDIIVAKQRGNAGMVTILETWKDELKAGASIQVADLPIAPMQPQVWVGGPPEKTVTGNRMILFLVPGSAKENSDTHTAAQIWHGVASYSGTKVSVAWIEGDAAYAFEQVNNPGPTELEKISEKASLIQDQTRDILTSQEGLRKAMTIQDAAARATALESLAKLSVWECRREAVAALGGCGRAGLPMLHEMLHDGHFDQTGVVNAIGTASGDGAGDEMKAILTAEAEFWTHAAPGLPVGWWNNVEPGDRREALRNQYELLSAALNQVAKLHYAPALEVIQSLRNLWLSFPQLNDKLGFDPITNACDAALKAIDAPAGNPDAGK